MDKFSSLATSTKAKRTRMTALPNFSRFKWDTDFATVWLWYVSFTHWIENIIMQINPEVERYQSLGQTGKACRTKDSTSSPAAGMGYMSYEPSRSSRRTDGSYSSSKMGCMCYFRASRKGWDCPVRHSSELGVRRSRGWVGGVVPCWSWWFSCQWIRWFPLSRPTCLHCRCPWGGEIALWGPGGGSVWWDRGCACWTLYFWCGSYVEGKWCAESWRRYVEILLVILSANVAIHIFWFGLGQILHSRILTSSSISSSDYFTLFSCSRMI